LSSVLINIPADTEVSILSPISKKDLQDFYKHFIKPSSSHRSKVAIHLIAQSAPSEIASSMTPEEQSQKVMTLLAQYLNSAGIAVDHEQLGKRMANADIASGDQDTLIEAVHTYLVEDAGIEASKAGAVIAEGQKLMATTLPSLGISTNPKSLSGEDQDAPTLTSAQPMTPVTFIKDPHKFKAGLRVSAGALPVKDLSEFAETESKL
jgi:insulysin